MTALLPPFGLATALLLSAAAVGVAGCAGGSAVPPTGDSDVARKEAEDWRAKHEADYRRDWVTIAGLHFLDPGVHSLGSAPSNDIVLPASAPALVGRMTLDGQSVRFEPQSGVAVQRRGQGVTEPVVLKDDGSPEPDELLSGGVRMVVHVSGARKSLRVWDPEGPLAKGFLGFRWFEIRPDYRVLGRFIADGAPKDVHVMNTFGDMDRFSTEGVVEFTLGGQTLRLRPFTTRPKRLYFVFKDASSGEETYSAARFLYADLRDDRTAILDFNQAYNPPCAFNPYTTCPIPLPENRLPVKVLAGERAYPVHVELAKS